jgi:hypothetical protein
MSLQTGIDVNLDYYKSTKRSTKKKVEVQIMKKVLIEY